MVKEINPQQEDLKKIVESARRLGVEINENEAIQWLEGA